MTLEEMTKTHILYCLNKFNTCSINKIAEQKLKISERTLYRYMEQFDIKKSLHKKFEGDKIVKYYSYKIE